MKKILLMTLMLLTMGISGFAQNSVTVIIGDTTASTTTYSVPFDNFYKNTWTQTIYPASDIAVAGMITSIAYQVGTAPTSADMFSTVHIYMGTTSATENTSTSSWLPMADLTEVYTATNMPLPTTTGWQVIQLSTPFQYDGSENLVIVISKTMAAYNSGLKYTYTSVTNSSLYRQSDSDVSYANHPGSNTGTRSAYRPNLKLTINVSADFCYPVSNLAVNNLTSTDALITWNASNSTGVNYILQYKTAGQNWTNATSVDVYDTTYDMTGMLTATTEYNVRVATDCGTDTSSWKNLAFTTPCDAISTLPFSEGFDTYGTGESAYPTCWGKINTYTSPRPYCNTSAYAGAASLYFYAGTSGTYNIAVTPGFDATIPVNTLQATFMYKASGVNDRLVVGVMTNPSDASTFVPVDTISPAATASTWVEKEVNFSPYAGSGQYIAFKNAYTSSAAYAYIDNLVIDLIPTCPKPRNLAMVSNTQNSIELSWTEMGTATTWDIEYGPMGFTPGTGNIETATTNPYTITGLDDSQQYDFYVRSDCGGGDISLFSEVYTSGTACTPITTLPFTDNFDSHPGTTVVTVAGENLPYCWSKLNTGTSYTGLPNIYASATYAASGNNCLRFYTYTTTAYDDQLMALPEIDPLTYPASNLQVSFEARNNSSYNFKLMVGVMTDPTDKATFVAVDSIETTSNTYAPYDIPLSQYTGTGSYIALMAPKPTSSYNAGYVDNLMVDIIPTCPRPKNLAASNPTVNSIDLAWTETGNATSWEIEYGPMGFTQGDGTIVSASSNPFTVNGLEHSTGYDFYVRATCGGNDNSYWSSKITAATACAPITNLPLIENFDAYAGTTTTGAAASDVLPYCWSNLNTGTSYAGLPNIYASATYAASGNNSLRFYTYTSTAYDDQIAVLPQIDATSYPVNTLQISMDVRDYSTSYPFKLVVGVMTDPTNKTTFTPVDTITTAVTSYANFIVTFDNYNGTGEYIALMAPKPTANYNYGQVDNVVLEVIPTCPRPTAFTATPTVTDEVVLSWTDNNASQWDILYGVHGFDPTDATAGTLLSSITSNPYTLAGLTNGVIYDFYVRANCGGGDFSEWTITPATASPYTIAMGITGTDTVTGCDFTVTDDGGIAGDYSNNCNYTLVIFPGEADSVVSVSGTFVGEGTVDYLSVYDGSVVDENNLLQKIVSGTTGNVINFGPLSSTTGPLTLLFHSDGSVVRDGFAAQVSCVEAPACPKPFDVHATYVTNNEATVAWSVMDGAPSSFNVVIGTTPNFNPDAATDVITVNTTEYTFTGLSPYTNYYVFVQTDCGNDVSEWTSAYDFRTACDPITTLPFSENFDGITGSTTTSMTTTNLPYCWSNINEGTTYGGYPFVYASATYASSGVNSMRYYTYSTSAYDDQIAVLPLIDPDLYPVNTLQISFDARLISTSYPFQLVVGVLSSPTDKSTFVAVDTINASSTTYQHYEISLNEYQGTGSYIALMAPKPATSYNEGYVDNILVEEIPNCPKPINFVLAGVAATSVDLTWTEVGDATAWEIEYGAPGFTPGGTAGTVVSVTTNPYTLDNLTPSTTYDIYLRSDCGSEYSPYSYNVITVTTACLPIDSLPYVEGFDTYGTGTGIYPTCWDRINTYSTTTNYPYISTTHYDGVGSLYFYAGTSGTYNIAVSPLFDVTIPVNTLQATFMWRAANATSRLEVGVMTNPTDATTFVPIDTIVASATSTWEGFEVSFGQYTGEGHYIAFRVAYNSSATGYGYLDNLVIDLIPTCPRPLHVTASNPTTNSIDLSWDQDGTPNSWVIEYGPAGFTPGTGTEVTATTNPFTVTGLNPSTIYNFYVTAECGGGDSSARSFAASGATSCAAVSALPYIENFDGYGTGTTVYPLCWGRINTYTSGDRPYVNSTCYAGVGSLYFYATSTSYNIAITPEFDATIPINTLQATFMYRASNATDYMIVGVMTNPTDASTFVPVDTVAPTGSATAWTEKEVVFSGYTGNGHYIAFYNGNSSSTCYSYIDNLNINLIPSCPKPQNVHVVSATINSVELGWTEVGSATSWEIAYGAPGFDLDDASATTVVTATSNPFTVTGLNSTSTYEFYVRASCGGTDFSYWSSSLQASTSMVPVSLPYTADFSTNDAWVLNNGSCTNYWMKGTVNNEPSLFVTNNGSTPGYTITSISANAAQKLFTVGTSDTITITFDVMVDGEGGYDYLKLFLAPAATQFLPSTTAPGTGDYAHRDYSTNAYNFYANGFGTQTLYPYVLNKLTDTIHVVAKMPNPNATPTSSSTALLALVWRNDGSGGTQPPAIVKNLTVTASGGTVVVDPTVATNAANPVAQTTATLHATITNPDNVTITAKGFQWKATTGGTYTQIAGTGTGNNFTADLTNLTPNTSYTYKAFITFNGTTVEGEEMTFTTLQQGQPTEPTVATNAASSIAQTTATLNATITNPDGVTITAKGFQWKTTTGGTYTTVNGTGTGNTFTAALSNLTPNTSYTFKAFITFNGQTVEGGEMTFTTLPNDVEPCDVPTGLDTTTVANESITITWNANANVNSWNIQYRPVGGQWSNATANTNSYTITGLTGNTDYEIQVQANCGGGNLSDWSSSLLVHTHNTGLMNYLENSVVLFPNPAKEYVDIRIDGELNVTGMEVYDVYGKLINTVGVCDTPVQTRINVSTLANGMYFVRVTTEEGVVTKTFVKR